jgi:hypothetical protein
MQTAVEFLLSELDINKLIEREKLTMAAEVVRQAKEMEKEQIINAFDTGFNEDKRIGKEYYNETYER